MKRGDIVLLNLPQNTGNSGHEQTGTRPALVVHDDATSDSLSLIMIVPITSNLSVQRFSHTIIIQPSRKNGLTMPSVLMVFQLRALDKARVIKKIGEIEESIMDQVNSELKKLLGI